MKKSITIAPLNSLILVMDRTAGEIPDPNIIGNSLVTATPSCLSIGTLCSVDGDTTIILSDNENEIRSNLINVYDGVLVTPNTLLSVCTVLDEPVLELRVQDSRTRVQVWANDSSEPNEITILALSSKGDQCKEKVS